MIDERLFGLGFDIRDFQEIKWNVENGYEDLAVIMTRDRMTIEQIKGMLYGKEIKVVASKPVVKLSK